MYKGNMKDFVNKVDSYINKHYSAKLIFGKTVINSKVKIFLAYFAPGQMGAVGYEVFDTDDFEEQVYDYVNKQLEDVQGKHYGFLDESTDLFEQEIPKSENGNI